MTLGFLTLAAVLASAAPTPYPEPRTDPRFELFAAVQLLAGAERSQSGFHRLESPYTRAAEKWFRPFIAHPAVEVYNRLTATGLDPVFFHGYIVSLGDPPSLEQKRPFEPANLADAGGAEAMELFRLLLADFARVARFEGFYQETAALRKAMTDDVSRQASALDLKRRLERYTGMPVTQRYTVILSPFVAPVLASTWVSGEGRTRRLTSLYGPEEHGGRVVFRLSTRSGSLWTEILMDQLGPAARPHRVRLNRSKSLYASLGSACAPDWYECVQRHVAFAAAARLLALSGEHENAKEWPVKYARIGLPHIGALVERLHEYEADRTRYPRLIDFYPRLIEELEAAARAGAAVIPFQGGISAVLRSSAPVTVILPGSEPKGLRAAARRRWKDASLLTDTEALTADLKGRTLVALGTVSGNRWLTRRLTELQLPWRLEGSTLSFNPRPGETKRQIFEGKLGLISTAVNPVDGAQGLLLYTALEPDLLPPLDGSYEGPADFVVLDRGAAVKSGRYEKSRRPWRLQ